VSDTTNLVLRAKKNLKKTEKMELRNRRRRRKEKKMEIAHSHAGATRVNKIGEHEIKILQ